MYPGWLGLGWNLSAGGCIRRNVRGVYDEKYTNNNGGWGFYSHCTELQRVNNSNDFKNFKDHYTGENNAAVFELMTDEYNFNFGQYSGTFYLDEYGKWVVVSDDDIKVEFDESSGFRTLNNLRSEIITTKWLNKGMNRRFFDKFTLITPDGKRYTFGGQNATEYSINYYNRNKSDLIATSWFLTKIQSPEGYSITLEYEAGAPICEIKFSAFSSFVYKDFPDPGSLFSGNFLASGDIKNLVNNTQGYRKLSGYLMFPVYLKQIKATYVKVEFHSSELFTDKDPTPYEDFLAWENTSEYPQNLISPFSNEEYTPAGQFEVFMPASYRNDPCKISQYLKWRTLKGITVNNLSDNSFTKTFYLDYRRDKRKKLSKISEQKGTYTPDSTWIFGGLLMCGREYLSQMLMLSTPVPETYAPKEYIFTYNTTEKFPRYIFASTDHWGYYNGFTEAAEKGERSFGIPHIFDETFYNVRNSTYNINIAQAETLKEIIYPARGKTLFTYQQNRYSKIVPADLNNDLIVSSGTGGGLCVSEIKNFNEENKLVQTKKYYYAEDIPVAGSNTYATSGILKAKKNYVMNYNFNNGYYAVCSEGGFMAEGTNQSDPLVGYSSVIEETIDESGNSNGYIRYRYTNYDEDIWGEKHMDRNYEYSYNITGNTYSTPISSKSVERGKIMSEEYFDSNKRLLKSVEYKYAKVNNDSIKAPLQEMVIINSDPNNYIYAYFAFMNYIYTYRYLLKEVIENEIDVETGNILLAVEKKYEYNSHNVLASESIKKSNGNKQETIYTYNSDISLSHFNLYAEMTNAHILDALVEKTIVNYDNNDHNSFGDVIASKYIQYKKFNNNLYKPYKIFNLYEDMPRSYRNFYTGGHIDEENNPTDDKYVQEMEFTHYDSKGNIIQYTTKDGISTTILWAYNYQYPVAEIKNATYSEVQSAYSSSNQLAYVTEYTPSDDLIYILGETLRKTLPDSEVTVYTYKPLVGMTSQTDPRGVTTYYNYDNFGRLKETYIIEYGKKKILQAHDYHYRK